LALLGQRPEVVSVSLPFGEKAAIALQECRKRDVRGYATVVKDAGDDPDVTNGAVIGAELSFISAKGTAARRTVPVILHGGRGVGLVTKPGLPVRKGSPAINPVPRAMIRRAIREAIAEAGDPHRSIKTVDVTIFVPDGEALAKKTFNPRLGILGGISILGTTGIVKPFSHQAYKETIALALNIARASGCTEVVLSTGGQSERLAMARFSPLRGESFIQMGDYVGFSLKQALSRGFRRITVAAFMGKLAKIAAGASNTHAGNFPLEVSFVAALGKRLRLNADLLRAIERSVTMRGVLELLLRRKAYALIDAVCRRAIQELYRMTGGKGSISILLFSFDGTLLWHGGKEGRREGIG
jgi:cobalt-precorrin-5B (C1)-methyltransferase